MPRDWLNSKHPVYTQWTKDHTAGAASLIGVPQTTKVAGVQVATPRAGPWLRNEIRLRGGDEVLDYLRKFEWETDTGQHFADRKREATYINFPDLFVTAMLGHLMREAPQPGAGLNFGTLGDVRVDRETTDPNRAELVYYNADGVGNDGSQWDNFWLGALRRAHATGHRWIFVESTPQAPQNRQDELDGRRPYLVEYSPLAVPNWHFEAGRLQWAIVKMSRRVPQLVNGKLEGNDFEEAKLFLVAEGFEGFDSEGEEYSGGGWWVYDGDGEPVTDSEGEALQGDWENTRGQIPLFPLFYERDQGSPDFPAISRPALTELGQLAVSYMNLSSAADWDFYDAASSIQWLLGVDKDAYELAMTKVQEGSRFLPLPSNNQDGTVPKIHDGSQGAVTAEIARAVLERKREVAKEIALREATSTPDSSGRSKIVGFEEQKAPRLALLASELEQAQNTALHFLEMRFGPESGSGLVTPRGYVSWPRKFDLAALVDEIRELFELENLSGYTSPTVAGRAMARIAEDKGLVEDDEDLKRVQAEYSESAAQDRTRRRQESAQDDEIDRILAGTGAEG